MSKYDTFNSKFRSMWDKEYERQVDNWITTNNIDLDALECNNQVYKPKPLTWKVDKNNKIV